MSRKPVPKPDDPAQKERFIKMAREIEADETKEGAERAFRRVVDSPTKKNKRD